MTVQLSGLLVVRVYLNRNLTEFLLNCHYMEVTLLNVDTYVYIRTYLSTYVYCSFYHFSNIVRT